MVHKSESFQVHTEGSDLTSWQIECWKKLDWYFERSTMFWNYLVYHLDHSLVLKEYLAPNSDDKAANALVDAGLNLLNGTTASERSRPRLWRQQLTMINQLPRSILELRLMDLLNSYQTVRVNMERASRGGFPKRKTERSRQSFRLQYGKHVTFVDFDEGATSELRVGIDGSTPEMRVYIPDLMRLKVSKNIRSPEDIETVTFTKYPVRLEDPQLGPSHSKDQVYTVVFHGK